MNSGRISKAKQALILFMRSLPLGCYFRIVSFGTNHTSLEIKDMTIVPYDDDTASLAIEKIEKFTADYGGTNILSPLKDAQKAAA